MDPEQRAQRTERELAYTLACEMTVADNDLAEKEIAYLELLQTALGLPDDSREYGAAAAMLRHLGVRSVQLMTNNPEKVDALRALGMVVRERRPVIIEANPFSAAYLATKRDRMRHELPGLIALGDAE